MGGKTQSRAESLLPEVLPDIITLLNEAPDFGQCGVEIVFHDSRITRIITRKEASRKADERPPLRTQLFTLLQRLYGNKYPGPCRYVLIRRGIPWMKQFTG
jgi:hypothetical protein